MLDVVSTSQRLAKDVSSSVKERNLRFYLSLA